jgi:hypothetical protein
LRMGFHKCDRFRDAHGAPIPERCRRQPEPRVVTRLCSADGITHQLPRGHGRWGQPYVVLTWSMTSLTAATNAYRFGQFVGS